MAKLLDGYYKVENNIYKVLKVLDLNDFGKQKKKIFISFAKEDIFSLLIKDLLWRMLQYNLSLEFLSKKGWNENIFQ